MTFSKRSYVSGSRMVAKNGAKPVPDESKYKFLPGFKSSSTKVPVGFLETSNSSPTFTFCKIEVSGPSGTLIEKNSSSSS